MPAGLHPFYCEQGATFSRTITITGLDLTGRTVRGCVWDAKTGTKIKDFTTTIVTAASGIFKISLTAVETAAIAIAGTYASQNITSHQYNVEIVNADTTVMRLLNGEFQVSPEGKSTG